MEVNLPNPMQFTLPRMRIKTDFGGEKTAVSTIPAAVILCEKFLTFADNHAARAWADETLQLIDPALKLSEQAVVEVIVGRDASSSAIQTKMQELLQLLMQRNGLPERRCDILFFEGSLKRPQARVWCVTAVYM